MPLDPDSHKAGGHGRITRCAVSFVAMVVRPWGTPHALRPDRTGRSRGRTQRVLRAGVRLSRAGREVNSPLDERVVRNSRFAPHTVVNPPPEIVGQDRFPD
jgi:hypothetical protein